MNKFTFIRFITGRLQIDNLKLSCKKKKKRDSGKEKTIQALRGRKYSDKVGQVYYEMLFRNAGIANIDLERVTSKSLTAA